MPNIFDYTDYRNFLRDYFEEQRRSAPFLSFRYVGSKVHIDASQLLKIVQGQLHLSKARTPDIIKFCKLRGKEQEYFKLLIGYNKAKSTDEARMYFDKLVAISGVSCTELEKDQYRFFMRWYYASVWCSLNIFNCDTNYQELGNFLEPAVEESEVKEAIELLKRLGLIEKNSEGFWKSTDQNLSTGKSWRTQAVKQYQQDMIRLAGESLERIQKDERDISSVTLNVNEETLEEMRVVTEEYRRTMIKLSNQTESNNRVYQLNIQLFPITKQGGKV